MFCLSLLILLCLRGAVQGCSTRDERSLLHTLGKGYLEQYMSYNQNFDSRYPLRYNEHGICQSRLKFVQLPDTYFPRYLRYVECQEEGRECIFGKICRTVDAYINLLQKRRTSRCDSDGYEIWDIITYNIGAGCECAVERQ